MMSLARFWVVACGLLACFGFGCESNKQDPTDVTIADLTRRADAMSTQIDKAEDNATSLVDRLEALNAVATESGEIAKVLDGIEAEKLKREQFDKVRALLDRLKTLDQRRKAALEKAKADLKQQKQGS